MLVGHYEMLAMTLNSLRVEPDAIAETARGCGGSSTSLQRQALLRSPAPPAASAARPRSPPPRAGAELYLTDVQAEALERDRRGDPRRRRPRRPRAGALDIRDHDAVVALAAEIHAAHGSMDVVMNVAGVSTWGTIEQLEHSDWQQMIDVNLVGPISVLECFVPPMIAAGRGGHVVNVSSAAGLFGLPWHAAYSAAKFGLRGVSEVLRFDLRRARHRRQPGLPRRR